MRGIASSFIAVAATLAVAAPAGAAADRTVTVSGTAPKVEWDGAAGNGLEGIQDCGAPSHTCDTTLINVKAAGTLVVTPTGAPNAPDVDIALYRSDAGGKQGDLVKESNSPFVPDRVSGDVEPGYYLAVVSYGLALQGGYHGVATLATSAVEWSADAPGRHVTLTAAKPEFKWSGSGSGLVFDCGEVNRTVQPCDHTLVHLTKAGDLSVDIKGTSPTNQLEYLAVYMSDKAGSVGDSIGQSVNIGADQSLTAGGLEAGYYLVEVGWLAAGPAATFDGTAGYTPAETPAASASKRKGAAKKRRR